MKGCVKFKLLNMLTAGLRSGADDWMSPPDGLSVPMGDDCLTRPLGGVMIAEKHRGKKGKKTFR